MELNPVPVLMSMIIYSNIGGAITPVGDPPNVILASYKEVMEAASVLLSSRSACLYCTIL